MSYPLTYVGSQNLRERCGPPILGLENVAGANKYATPRGKLLNFVAGVIIWAPKSGALGPPHLWVGVGAQITSCKQGPSPIYGLLCRSCRSGLSKVPMYVEGPITLSAEGPALLDWRHDGWSSSPLWLACRIWSPLI